MIVLAGLYQRANSPSKLVDLSQITHASIPNADLYQLLAYVTALDLPGGLLIYAAGEAEPATYRVQHTGKRLQVAALDLSGTLDGALARVSQLAEQATALRAFALKSNPENPASDNLRH